MESISRRLEETDEIQELIRACGTGSSLEQNRARELLKLVGEPAVDQLIEALLHDYNALVRSSSAEVLGYIGDPRAVAPLIDALRDRDSAVQWRATEALASIGEAAEEPLMERLRNPGVGMNEKWNLNLALKDLRAKKSMREGDEIYRKLKNAAWMRN